MKAEMICCECGFETSEVPGLDVDCPKCGHWNVVIQIDDADFEKLTEEVEK